MQLPTQEQFVKDCLTKYRWEPLPADQKWEAAHFPLPKCSDEGDTVQLWSADHTVQGLLQSVELDHKCFNHRANEKDLLNLQTYYPQYLPLFQQLKSQFSRQQGKKNVELKLGFHAPEMLGVGGKKIAELKLGVHGRSAEQMTADGKKGGKKAASITNAQRWQCLVTGHISNSGALARYQKKRGIDTKLRVKLTQQEVDDLERKS